MGETYVGAGVDITLGDKVARLIGKHARTTLGPEVLRGVGFFGGLYEFKGYENPVLVSSTDSVGTKLKIASALGKHDTVGIDIVNHCVNDILTCGASPLFFLDYIGIGKLEAKKAEDIVRGLAQACREIGCALIGGETAELSGVYHGGDYDLVGFVIGVVEKNNIIMGKDIAIGDTIIGLPSSGLHTNGFSLVLLEPHRCYYHQLKPLLPVVKGMAHITGGGLTNNVPRVLPDSMSARFDGRTWTVPPIFRLIQQRGNVDRDEMYRVFNMGIGMVVICSAEHVSQITEALPEARVVGEVIKQSGEARTVIE